MSSTPAVPALRLEGVAGGSRSPTPQPDCADRSSTSVRVALRVRPLIPRERLEGAKNCVIADATTRSVLLARQRQFTFDQVYDQTSSQQQVYDECVADLVDACLEGYNATVLAYGPTGSGKTFTMGSGSALHYLPDEQGIIPRAIRQLFQGIEASSGGASFSVRAQFLEIYNEEVRDLLAEGPAAAAPAHAAIAIREAPHGQILVTGAREEPASCYEDLVRLLDLGAAARATSATAVNERSSRSHAIFTIIVEQSIHSSHQQQQQRQQQQWQSPRAGSRASSRGSGGGEEEGGQAALRRSCGSGLVQGMTTPRTRLLQQLNKQGGARTSLDSSEGGWGEGGGSEASGVGGVLEYRCAKFHLVDLAGSERTKRSGVVGVRFREAVTINQGLLTLGNVISALGDERKRPNHVPYRDSKLTRLLQDSLGGNAKTTMIACISCADDCLEESLNTLKYAQRARHIKNRPVVNREHLASASALQQEIQALQWALLKQLGQGLGHSSLLQVPDLLLEDLSGQPPSLAVLQQLRALAANAGEWSSTSSSQDSEKAQLLQQEHQRVAADHQERISALHDQLAGTAAQLTDANAAAAQLAAELAATKEAVAATAAAAATEATEAALHRLAKEVQQQVQELAAAGDVTVAGQQQLLAMLQRHTCTDDTEGQHHAVAHDQERQPGNSTADPAHLRQQLQQQLNLTGVHRSLQSHPLPCVDASVCDERAVVAIKAAAAAVAMLRSSQGQLPSLPASDASAGHDQELVQDLRQQLASAQADLAQDDAIFSEKQQEIQALRVEVAALQAQQQAAQQQSATQLAQLQHELNRWRSHALALYGSPPGSRPTSPTRSYPAAAAADTADLSGEPSFAAGFPSLPAAGGGSPRRSLWGGSSPACLGAQPAAAGAVSWPVQQIKGEDSQVVYDDDLMSYISDTDYAELAAMAAEEGSSMQQELQQVLADRAALEAEKRQAEEAAAEQQREFERARAVMEAQLRQLSTHMNSKQALIAALQRSEAEARLLSQQYQERCQQLEAAIADKAAEVELLQAAMVEVEADVLASAEDKAAQRAQHEARIEALQGQLTQLRKQLKDQHGLRLDKERQRTALRIQQLQTDLRSMRNQQDGLRQRLQENMASHERQVTERNREMVALRKAADAARKRMAELEADNMRARAALAAKAEEVTAAQRRIRELTQQQANFTAQQRALGRRAGSTAGSVRSSRADSCFLSPRSNTSEAGTPRNRAKQQQQQQQPAGRSHPNSSAPPSPRQSEASSSQEADSKSQEALSRQPTGEAEAPAAQATAATGQAGHLPVHVATWCSQQLRAYSIHQQLKADVGRLEARQEQLMQQVFELQEAAAHCRPDETATGEAGEQVTTPAGAALQQGMEDALDAAHMELLHVTGQLTEAGQQLQAASAAVGELQQVAEGLPEADVRLLLQRMLRQLVEQSARNRHTRAQVDQLAAALQEQKAAAAAAEDRLALQGWDHQLALTELTRRHEERLSCLLSNATGTCSSTDSSSSSAVASSQLGPGNSQSVVSACTSGAGRLSVSASTGKLAAALGQLLSRPLEVDRGPGTGQVAAGQLGQQASEAASKAGPARGQAQLLGARSGGRGVQQGLADHAGTPGITIHPHRSLKQDEQLELPSCSSPRLNGSNTPPAARSAGSQVLRSSSQALQEQLQAYKAHLRQASRGGGLVASPNRSASKPRSPLSAGGGQPTSPLRPSEQQAAKQQQDVGARRTLLPDLGGHACTSRSPKPGQLSSASGDHRCRQGLSSRSVYLAALEDVALPPDTGALQ